MFEHYQDETKREFNKVLFIDFNKATKSTILFMESFLIRCMNVSGEYFSNIINIKSNSNKHNYYNKDEDEKVCKDIWNALQSEDIKIAHNDYKKIIKKNEYKYSPYVALNESQTGILNQIINELITKDHNKILIEGASGTGKSALAIQLFKTITDYSNSMGIISDNMVGQSVDKVIKINQTFCQEKQKYRIAYLTPMKSFRKIIAKSIKKVPGLRSEDLVMNCNYINEKDLELIRIYSGSDLNYIVKNYYTNEPLFDLIIVDETHRLNWYKNLIGNVYEDFQIINKKLGLAMNKNENDGNQADWIERISKNQIYFYDENQRIRSSDISKEWFNNFFSNATYREKLNVQERCLGGENYINYVRDILQCKNPKKKDFNNYKFIMFDSLEKMKNMINSKKEQGNISLMASGYDFKENLVIDGKAYSWNKTNGDWVNSKHEDNEIGCVYVLGGVDVDYLGVIIGNEVYYDQDRKKIKVDKQKYLDRKGKSAVKDEIELEKLVLDIYYILLTRGMRGTYIYAKDQTLKKYLEKYIDKI